MTRVVLVSCFALTVALPAMALSQLTDVTPANITKQPLTLRVTHENYQDGTVRFEIYVSAGTERVSSSHKGGFVLWQEKVAARSGSLNGDRSLALARCSVQERVTGDALLYEFSVNRELLDRVTFTFYNFETSMPRFDGYEFILWEFAGERK